MGRAGLNGAREKARLIKDAGRDHLGIGAEGAVWRAGGGIGVSASGVRGADLGADFRQHEVSRQPVGSERTAGNDSGKSGEFSAIDSAALDYAPDAECSGNGAAEPGARATE